MLYILEFRKAVSRNFNIQRALLSEHTKLLQLILTCVTDAAKDNARAADVEMEKVFPIPSMEAFDNMNVLLQDNDFFSKVVSVV